MIIENTNIISFIQNILYKGRLVIWMLTCRKYSNPLLNAILVFGSSINYRLQLTRQ